MILNPFRQVFSQEPLIEHRLLCRQSGLLMLFFVLIIRTCFPAKLLNNPPEAAIRLGFLKVGKLGPDAWLPSYKSQQIMVR